MTPIQQVLDEAFRFTGQKYVFGAEGDQHPRSWIGPVDCSELVQIACNRAGVLPRMPDGAFYQWRHTAAKAISVGQARTTLGALMFVGDGTGQGRNAITHVGFSLGDGRTFEARGTRWVVGVFNRRSGWTYAATIPGVDHTSRPPIITQELTKMAAQVDLSGLVAFVDLAYEAYGRAPGTDPMGRLYWVRKALVVADPLPVMEQMITILEEKQA